MRQVADSGGPDDCRSCVIRLVPAKRVAGVDADADTKAVPDKRPLDGKSAPDRVAGVLERGYETVAFALLERADPAVSGQQFVDLSVQVFESILGSDGIRLPRARRVLHVAQQECDGPRRQLEPLRRHHVSSWAYRRHTYHRQRSDATALIA